MSSELPLSRHGLPLLGVLLAHGLLLAWLGRSLLPLPAPQPLALLPVALLGPESAPAGGSVAPEAEAAVPVAEPDVPMPLPEPVAPAPEPPPPPVPLAAPGASLPAPGGSLQAPGADTVAAAALDDPLAPPAPAARVPSGPETAPVSTGARLYPGTPEPPYPEAARRHREQGSVTLQLQVRADGRVAAVNVLRSSGSPRLDQAARDAAWRWRLLPAEREGRAVDSLFEKTLHFRLED